MDYGFIETQYDRVVASLKKRKSEFNLAEIEKLALEKNELQTKYDETKAKANQISKDIGVLVQQKASQEEIQKKKQETLELKEKTQTLSEQYELKNAELKQKLLYLPNVLDETVHEGANSEDNKLIRVVGEPTKLSFAAKSHEVLGELHGIMDFERAAKITGARFSIIKGWGARLERALTQLMLDTHREHGYEEISLPYMVNDKSMYGTGQLPKFGEDAFALKDPEYYLIPTAEVPVTNYYRDDVLSESQLPAKFVAYSPCFRREAGSYGKDTKGLIRQHQFHKVEIMIFSHPEKSYEVHELLTSHAENILKTLGLPYRVMSLCSGDIGFGAAKTYDLEVWLPGQNAYREISSCSNFEEFQARRANIKFKPEGGGKPRFLHTLNGSGLAVGRTLLAVLENGQQEDGSIQLPKALQKYGLPLEIKPPK